MKIFIRQISSDDASAVTLLSHQLGYNPSVEQTAANIRAILRSENNNGFVAVNENEVIGWIGVSQAFQIESPPLAEIRGLVVHDQYRNKGIGKMLVEKAKSWSREKGNKKLRLRCNMKRKETHLFYLHLDFKEVKEQKVFEIDT